MRFIVFLLFSLISTLSMAGSGQLNRKASEYLKTDVFPMLDSYDFCKDETSCFQGGKIFIDSTPNKIYFVFYGIKNKTLIKKIIKTIVSGNLPVYRITFYKEPFHEFQFFNKKIAVYVNELEGD